MNLLTLPASSSELELEMQKKGENPHGFDSLILYQNGIKSITQLMTS